MTNDLEKDVRSFVYEFSETNYIINLLLGNGILPNFTLYGYKERVIEHVGNFEKHISEQEKFDNVRASFKPEVSDEDIHNFLSLYGFDNSGDIYKKRIIERIKEIDETFKQHLMSFFDKLGEINDGNTK